MTKAELINQLDDLFEVPRGTLSESSHLRDIATFDSLKLLELIAMADEQFAVIVSPEQMMKADTIADLLQLLSPEKFA